MSYEEIKKANESIVTTQIKDKNYAEVSQRIKAFRMVYPEGTIKTEMIFHEGGICIFRAEVSNNGALLGTGTAQENEKSSFINKTSYIENCETSAVGRALGMCGFGIDTSVASAEEVKNAMLNQDNTAVLSQLKDNQIEWLVKTYRLKSKNQITQEMVDDLMNRLSKKEKEEK